MISDYPILKVTAKQWFYCSRHPRQSLIAQTGRILCTYMLYDIPQKMKGISKKKFLSHLKPVFLSKNIDTLPKYDII
jgi:hypothetical protein